MTRFRAPLGVVAVIYEARPNVTSDAAGLALKSGNAVISSWFELRPPLQPGDRSDSSPSPERGRDLIQTPSK